MGSKGFVLVLTLICYLFLTVQCKCRTRSRTRMCVEELTAIKPISCIMITPNWISKELFETSLRHFFNNPNIEILNFTSDFAVAAGENYTSDLFRTSITYKDPVGQKQDTISVIVKCGNEEGGVKQNISEKLHLFEKETEMFLRTFPAIYEILGERFTLSSNCLYAAMEPHRVIVLEDLTALNFEVLPRLVGYDLEHCFLVIEKMAQMHAASVVMYDKDPSLVKLYNEGLYGDNPLVREWVSASFKGLSDACSRWPGFEKYGYKLNALGDQALERSFKSWKRKLGGFNVLNHGDLWINNMMFSYHKDGRLKDMRFVDFQMNIFTSPAIDLHYFIATSTKIKVKNECIDVIIDHYYAQLLANLTKLQYSLERVPTRDQFKKDYSHRAFYGLLGAATVLPLVKASPRKDASFESIINDESAEGFRHHAFNNERYRQHMEFLLPYYDSFGALD